MAFSDLDDTRHGRRSRSDLRGGWSLLAAHGDWLLVRASLIAQLTRTTKSQTAVATSADKPSLECKVNKASAYASEGKPDTDNPNCSLDLESSSYSMKQLQKGVLSGFGELSACWNSLLTIDRNTKRVYMSFTRTKSADNFDKTRPGTCGALPRTEVLMNCTGWARSRKVGAAAAAAPPRYCDFSSSSDK
jgi:hypothetical protein